MLVPAAAASSSTLCSLGRSNPGLLASSPDGRGQGFSLLPPGCSSPGGPVACRRVLARMLQSGLLARAFLALRFPGCSSPGGPAALLLLPGPPRMLQSVVPGPLPLTIQYGGCASVCPGCSSLGRHIICPCRLWPAVLVGVLPFFSRALRCSSSPAPVRSSPLCSVFPLSLLSSPSSRSHFPPPRPVPCSLGPLTSLSLAFFFSLFGGFAGARTQAPSLYARILLCFGVGTHALARLPVFSFVRFVPCSFLHVQVPLFPRPFPLRMHFAVFWGAHLSSSFLRMHFATSYVLLACFAPV